jgi:hypothetical protein
LLLSGISTKPSDVQGYEEAVVKDNNNERHDKKLDGGRRRSDGKWEKIMERGMISSCLRLGSAAVVGQSEAGLN